MRERMRRSHPSEPSQRVRPLTRWYNQKTQEQKGVYAMKIMRIRREVFKVCLERCVLLWIVPLCGQLFDQPTELGKLFEFTHTIHNTATAV